MSRLPARAGRVAAAAAGLAAANALRFHGLLASSRRSLLAAAATSLLPLPGKVVVAAVGACVAGWAWGTVRLDALDRSPLLADVDRSGRAVVEMTGEARKGAFDAAATGSDTSLRGTTGR